MIRHVAMIRFVEGVDASDVAELDRELGTLPDLVPGIVAFSCGADLGVTDGSWDYVVVADFATVDDYRRYATHPSHVEILRTVTGPRTARVERVQYRI